MQARFGLDSNTEEHVASPQVGKAVMNMDQDVLDVTLIDHELLSEVELLAEVVVGAQPFDRQLKLDEIDRLLGLPVPLTRSSRLPLREPSRRL